MKFRRIEVHLLTRLFQSDRVLTLQHLHFFSLFPEFTRLKLAKPLKSLSL